MKYKNYSLIYSVQFISIIGFPCVCNRPLEMDGLSYPASNVSESFREAERQLSASSKSSDSIRKGSSGVVGSMMLLKSHQSMHAPYTQVHLKFLEI